MKQLDEMERMAREWTEEYQSSLSADELSNELARALLAVMPVVRAAEAWRDSWPVTNRQSVLPEVAAVMDAVDALRRGMGEE